MPQPARAQHETEAWPPILTLDEAAKLLRLTPGTLRALVRQQRVPSYRFAGGRRLLFKPNELLALLQLTTPRPRPRRATDLLHASDETPPSPLDDLCPLGPLTEHADAQPAPAEIPGPAATS